jgi:hypothetical protein
MVWSVLGTIAVVLATIVWLVTADALTLSAGIFTGFFVWLFGRGVWQFAGSMENKGFDDPVYKKNLQRLIERNRQFEDARKTRNEPHS